MDDGIDHDEADREAFTDAETNSGRVLGKLLLTLYVLASEMAGFSSERKTALLAPKAVEGPDLRTSALGEKVARDES